MRGRPVKAGPPGPAVTRGFWLTFFFFGFVNNLTYVIFLTAAETLVPNHAGLVLLCSIVPGLITKLTLGFWAPRVPYRYRVSFVALILAFCCLVAASVDAVGPILAAVGVAAVGGAVGEGSFVALAGEWEKCIGGWSSGTGAAGIGGAGIFVAGRALGLGVSAVLRVVCVLPLLMWALYWTVIEWGCFRGEDKDAREDENDEDELPILRADPMDGNREDWTKGELSLHEETCTNSTENVCHDSLIKPVVGERGRDILRPLLVRFVCPLIVVYFAEYTINQGVLPTLDKFGVKDRNIKLYARFQFVYQVGVFVSRSSVEFVEIRRLWLLSVLQLVNLIFLTVAALYLFISNPLWVYLIVFYEGLLGGAAYVNTFSQLRRAAPLHLREWAMTVTTVGDSIGVSLAALVDTVVECGIRRARGGPTCAALSA